MRLAMAYATPASKFYRSKEVLAAVEGGLRQLSQFAYSGCPEPRNWWAWQIGMSHALIPTLLMTQGDLDAKLWADELKTVEYLLRDRGHGKGCEVGPPQTDMNCLWYLRLRFELAVLKDDVATARRWGAAMFRQMAPAGEGRCPGRLQLPLPRGPPYVGVRAALPAGVRAAREPHARHVVWPDGQTAR